MDTRALENANTHVGILQVENKLSMKHKIVANTTNRLGSTPACKVMGLEMYIWYGVELPATDGI